MERIDLTNLDIITLDGSTCKDKDDGIYVEKTDYGYNLKVAIADVSHYIKEGSAIDIEARERGNTLYTLGSVVPMIPKELSNGICSLNEGVVRFVGMCDIKLNNFGNVLDFEFYRANIKVRHGMHYCKTNEMIEADYEGFEEYNDVKEMIKLMHKLHLEINANNLTKGKIELDIAEVKPKTDETGKITGFYESERGIAERMIETFMVLSNECCAKEIDKKTEGGLGVYRNHDLPRQEAFMKLQEFMNANDIPTTFINNDDDVIPTTYQQVVEAIKGTDVEILLMQLTLRSMSKAVFEATNIGHFGLALEGYSMFTSPIRRYADLIAHRIVFDEKYDESRLEETCKHISNTERESAKLEKEVLKIKIVEYMSDKIGELYKGKVMGFSKKYIHILLENHVEVVSPLPSGFTYDPDTLKATHSSGLAVFNFGEEVDVEIIKMDYKNHDVVVGLM